jgi:RNA polymerase sigma factor (sigma-70 family)
MWRSKREEPVLANPSDIPLGPLLDAILAKDGGTRSDGTLLQQYIELRDERAFAALVRRHGPMVLGVCHRVLGNLDDAEDAFQATFFILLRKAASLTGRPTVGDWLHGVAHRTALKARAAAARRRVKERGAARPLAQCDNSRSDWLPRLDQELARLPANYRLPIVLCDLEGKTRRQAARQLGWPEGTVAGRLARARSLLAKRLLSDAQAVAAALLTGGAAHAGLPSQLFHSAIQAAAHAAAGNKAAGTALSAAALMLAKGVMRSMVISKIKVFTAVLVTTAALAGVGGWTVQMLPAGQNGQQSVPNQDAKGQGVQADQGDAEKLNLRLKLMEREAQQLQDEKKLVEQEIRRLRDKKKLEAAFNKANDNRDKALVDAAKGVWEGQWRAYEAGKSVPDLLPLWSTNWLKAQLRVLAKKSDIVAAYQAHFVRMQQLEMIESRRLEAGATRKDMHDLCVYYRIEAEIWLDEAKASVANAIESAKPNKAKWDIKSLETAVMAYQIRTGRFPATLAEMTAKSADGGPALIDKPLLTDPWGNPYEYNPRQINPRTGKPLIRSKEPPDEPSQPIANWTND